MQKTLLSVALVAAFNVNAVLGPVSIYLNTEYRTQNPVIGSIASTIKLNTDDIKATGANTFLELLATIPSAGFVGPQGNVPALFLRGSNANHTLVIIDGVKLHDISSPDAAAGYALESIPLAEIEQIEIVKGPYSSLYGSGAIGGVIQIFTKKGTGYNSADIIVGSNNSKKISFSSSNKGEQGFVNFNISKYQTDGISARNDSTEKDPVDNQSIGFKIGYQTNTETDFTIGLLNSTVNTLYDECFSASNNGNNCALNNRLTRLNLTIAHKFNDTTYSKLSFADIAQQRDNIVDDAISPFGNAKYQTKDLTLLNEIKLGNALLSIGLAKIEDKNITDNQTLSSQDIFAQWQKNISGFDINTGLRFINHSDFGRETVYNLGVAKSLNNGIKLTGSYGTAFVAPTIYQINYKTTNNLKPETSKSIEIGLEKQYYSGVYGVKFYNNKIIDFIDFNDDNGNFINDFYFNGSRLNIKGVESSISAKLANYQINFNHNYVSSELNSSNTQQDRRPKNTSDLTISKAYNKFNSRLQVINKSSSIDGATTLRGYTLTNLSTHYAYNNNSKISLNINNVFDKNYAVVNGYNQLGRTINIGLKYNF